MNVSQEGHKPHRSLVIVAVLHLKTFSPVFIRSQRFLLIQGSQTPREAQITGGIN